MSVSDFYLSSDSSMFLKATEKTVSCNSNICRKQRRSYLLVCVGGILILFVFAVAFLMYFSFSHTSNHSERVFETTIQSEISFKGFSCSANCYCNGNEENQRRMESVVSIPLYISFAAVSLAIAFSHANKHFEKECSFMYSSFCDDEDTDHEIEYCEEEEDDMDNSDEFDEDEEDEEVELTGWEKVWADEKQEKLDKLWEEYENYQEVYKCEGYCLINRHLRNQERQELSEAFNCEKHYLKKTIRVEIPKTGGKYFVKWDTKLKKSVKSYNEGKPSLNRVAKSTFVSEHLRDFCKQISVFEYWNEYIYSGGRMVRRKRAVSLCVGTSSVGTRFGNIKCEKIREVNW